MMETLDKFTGMMALIALAFALLGGFFNWYRSALLPDLREKLDDDAHRTRIIDDKTNPLAIAISMH